MRLSSCNCIAVNINFRNHRNKSDRDLCTLLAMMLSGMITILKLTRQLFCLHFQIIFCAHYCALLRALMSNLKKKMRASDLTWIQIAIMRTRQGPSNQHFLHLCIPSQLRNFVNFSPKFKLDQLLPETGWDRNTYLIKNMILCLSF